MNSIIPTFSTEGYLFALTAYEDKRMLMSTHVSQHFECEP